MNKILLGILLILAPVVGYCQSSNEITGEEILGFINTRDLIIQKPLNEDSLNSVIKKGKEIFQKGKLLPSNFNEEFSSQAANTVMAGTERLYRYNFLNNVVGQDGTIWDHYIVRLTLEFDKTGRVTDFYWDKPMRLKDKIIDVEQLEIFLRYVSQKDFHGMKNKGEEIFQKGRVLSKEHKVLFAEYLNEEKDNKISYDFQNSVERSPRTANIHLEVAAPKGEVINFSGIETW